MELRQYQVDAIDDLTTSAAGGKRRLLLVAPTGSGKTCISSQIIKNATSNGHRVLFLAHRRELVNQCEAKLESFGVKCGIVLSGEPWDPTHLVNVASIQTLHSWVIRRKRANPPKADLVVIDECFVAGTMIDRRQIESLRVGDYVGSFDEKTWKIVPGRISRIFTNPAPSKLYRIWTDRGIVVCTGNHPFLSVCGSWICAERNG